MKRLALKDIGDERAVEPLIEALRDAHIETRFAAAEALSDIGDERAVEPLIEALRDSEWNQRRVAIKALTKLISKFPELGDARTVSVLIATLKENDHNNWNYRVEYREEWQLNKIRRMAAFALGEIGDLRAAEPLIEALRDRDREVRSAVIEALTKLISKFPELEERIPF